MSKFVLVEPIVMWVKVFLLVNSPFVCREVFNHWFPENPWVEKERTVEQVVVRVWWPVVETGYKQQPRIGEAFYAW